MTNGSSCTTEITGRFIDIICAVAGLLLLAPLFAALGLLILIDDGPPVFFRQTRVGRNGKLFRIVKFRTMRAGAQGAMITTADDCRVTKVGETLRRHKLDEVPQLFNILIGDMSLVGPRPEVPDYVELNTPLWRTVLKARPGVTDLATLLYRDEERILADASDPITLYRENILPEKLRLNVGYHLSRSIWRDAKLILLTIYYSLLPARFNRSLIQRAFNARIVDA